MIITHKLEMDLGRRGVTPRIDAVQDDRYSRNLELTLLSGGAAWNMAEGCTAAVSYIKPDGTVGKYDTLPDGSSAWSAAGNVLTVALAPQALTVAGPVALHVHIYSGEAVLSTFEILLNVQRNPAIDADSEDYINMAVYLPQPQTAKVGQFLEVGAVDDQGKITAVKAVDAPSGGNGKTAYEYAQAGGYAGTEEEFAQKLAAGSLLVMMELSEDGVTITPDKTLAECIAAYKNGAAVYSYCDAEGGYIGSMNCAYYEGESGLVGFELTKASDTGVRLVIQGSNDGGNEEWIVVSRSSFAAKTDIPTKLPNPSALTFTGAVTGTYDGSEAKTVSIPSAPSALKNPYALTVNGTTYDGSKAVDMTEKINALIDSKLGVIENGAY